ncbi:MAG: hypothetical protein JKX67_06895 [Colwellia sp.]|nr:hypothetical protein [Colwellia sp.]
MKLTTIFSIALMLCSIKSYADESYAVKSIHDSEPSYLATDSLATNSLAINSSSIHQLLFLNDLIISSLDSSLTVKLPIQISGKFHSQLLSIEAGVMQSDQESNWSKYYFQGNLTLHQYNKFNLSLMANIEQLNNVYSLNFVNNSYQTPYVENLAMSDETELNYSYGLMGSYSVNSTWQFSGGIIHAQTFNELNSNSWYNNKNMALIGTTYSF